MLQAKRLLLIEDDPDIRETFQELLTLEGYQVTLAENGREGLHKLRSERPHAILLDVMMPVMDGYQFLEELRSQRNDLRTLPVIVLTAGKDVAIEENVIAVLLKPIDVDRLLAVLQERVFEGSRDA